MNKYEILINEFRDNEYLVIYGTGLASQIVYKALRSIGVKITFFVSQDNTIEEYLGVTVVDETKLSKDCKCIICANPDYKIENRLEKQGIQDWLYLDPILFRDYVSNRKLFYEYSKLVEENKYKIDLLISKLADDESRLVLDRIIKHRITPDSKGLSDIVSQQYFGNDVVPYIEGDFVDCGAYDGDTLKRFWGQLKDQKKFIESNRYYAFEADRNNARLIKQYCTENKINNVSIYECAVWNGKDEHLYFHTDDNDISVAGKVTEYSDTTIAIQAKGLDQLLINKNIDMIVMDIEGAEQQAIWGAEKIIKTKHPILAISIYHKQNHLWEIPLQILDIYDRYDIYIRHHRWNVADTVCYAIPRK